MQEASARLTSWPAAIVAAALICLALWPATRWVELSTGSEQLVVAAALESQRDGSWQRRLVPQMAGEPRLRKPPLTTWLAMAVVSPDEARHLAKPTGAAVPRTAGLTTSEAPALHASSQASSASQDRIQKDTTAAPSTSSDQRSVEPGLSTSLDDDGFRSLAGRIRGVALLLGLATLLLTYELGRVLSDSRLIGMASLLICGSTFFFAEQFSRLTTDVVLATTVVAANVAFAHAVLQGRRIGWVVAGMVLGLSFMAKGPVGVLQTVVPLGVFFVFARSRLRVADPQLPWVSLLLGVVLFLLVALPWFGYVLASEPGAWATWTQEVARTDATVPTSKPLAYLVLPLLVGPWTIFAVLGLLTATIEIVRRAGWRPRFLRAIGRVRASGLLWALLMVLVPIVIMTLFRDRKDRYLLPMIPPLCVLAAMALQMVFADIRRRPVAASLAIGGHWLIVLVLVVGLPITMTQLPRDQYDDATPWMSGTLGWTLASIGLMLWVVGVLAWKVAKPLKWRCRGESLICVATCLLFLYASNVFLWGYSTSREAQADLKPIAEAIVAGAPNAAVWHGEPFVPPDLLIYSGRVIRPLPSDLPPGQHVYVVRQRRSDIDPEPTMPPPWRLLATARRDRSLWWAFITD